MPRIRIVSMVVVALILVWVDVSIGILLWSEGGWPRHLQLRSADSGFILTVGYVRLTVVDLLLFAVLIGAHLGLAYMGTRGRRRRLAR